MLNHDLDLVFPYVCFIYGAMMTLVLQIPLFARLADERLPVKTVQNLRAHRVLSGICLWVGGMWILQNLWLT